MNDSRLARLLVLAFWPLTALVLCFDSRHFASWMPHGQWLSNVLTATFLLALISQMHPRRRLVALIFVPLSALGEMVFTFLLGLYHYRLGILPLYVPFGHAILLSVGLAIADSDMVRTREHLLKKVLLPLHGGVALLVLLLLGDALSVVFAAMFYGALRGQCGRPFYFILGVLVCYVEIVGTRMGCWVWELRPFDLLHTTNPPASAYGCYAIADFLALRCAALLEARLTRA